MSEVLIERRGRSGLITLNRPKALNALSLEMVRTLTATLQDWQRDPGIEAVAIRGMGREGPFGAFCAGGDIRFFHRAALAGDPALDDFFTEEYALDHLVHRLDKPWVVFMDGVVMGGGMGLAGHGAAHALRIATPATRMAMPETQIGFFPDVGGGWFLSRCPGAIGEFLALTGQVIGASDGRSAGLADGALAASELQLAWDEVGLGGAAAVQALRERAGGQWPAQETVLTLHREAIDRIFGLGDVASILAALEREPGDWARETAAVLRKRSPLMLHVVLAQIRRARGMSLADALRMERDMVHHAFHPAEGSEAVEGIRALAIDKDHQPRWNPAQVEQVDAAAVQAFFASPWTAQAHPLHALV